MFVIKSINNATSHIKKVLKLSSKEPILSSADAKSPWCIVNNCCGRIKKTCSLNTTVSDGMTLQCVFLPQKQVRV